MRIEMNPTIYIDNLAEEFQKSEYYRQGDNLFGLFPMAENGSYEWFNFEAYDEYVEEQGEDCLFCRVANFLSSEGIEDILICVFW